MTMAEAILSLGNEINFLELGNQHKFSWSKTGENGPQFGDDRVYWARGHVTVSSPCHLLVF